MMASSDHSSTNRVDEKDIVEVKKEPRNFKRFFWILLSLLVILALVLGSGFYFLTRPFPGRTNILVLGVAGEGHVGRDLTDTNIFLSLNHQTGKVLVLSLPRDIWIPALRTKLNSVYHYQGLEGAKRIVEEALGESVDYGVVINFDVFTELIDILGGVAIDVERSFDDYRYPISGKENDLCNGDIEYKCRYEQLHFESGPQIMDGERALKYVRSRFAEGEEGSDFARSKRQQRLLLAIKDEIISSKTLRNPQKLVELIKALINHIETDIPQEKFSDLTKFGLRFRSKNLRMEVLDDNRLVNPPPSKLKYDGQWVLVPSTGNWEEIHEYVDQLLIR